MKINCHAYNCTFNINKKCILEDEITLSTVRVDEMSTGTSGVMVMEVQKTYMRCNSYKHVTYIYPNNKGNK